MISRPSKSLNSTGDWTRWKHSRKAARRGTSRGNASWRACESPCHRARRSKRLTSPKPPSGTSAVALASARNSCMPRTSVSISSVGSRKLFRLSIASFQISSVSSQSCTVDGTREGGKRGSRTSKSKNSASRRLPSHNALRNSAGLRLTMRQ